MEQDISFIGLGQMGYGMATNIRKKISKSATIYINDINTKACQQFVKETSEYGPIEIVQSAKEAASRSEILLTMLPASKHVRQVYLDSENGVIAAPKDDNRFILECSTIDVDTTREVGNAVMDAGLGRYVDAPVSGGVRGAASANLAFMIGCPTDDPLVDRIKDIVSMMGPPEKIFVCGQLGNGLAAKISNNYLSGTFLIAISEAMAFGIRSGLDKNVLADVIRNSSGDSWMSTNLMPVPGIVESAPSSNGYKVGFGHEMIVKDLGLGIDAAEKQGIAPTMANTAIQHFKKAAQNPNCEGKDFTSVYLHITNGK